MKSFINIITAVLTIIIMIFIAAGISLHFTNHTQSAQKEFEEAGLELPVVFQIPGDCQGFEGLHYEIIFNIHIVENCTGSEIVTIHELAHAYVEGTLTQQERDAWAAYKNQEWINPANYDQSANETSAWAVTGWVKHRYYTDGLEILIPAAILGQCPACP